MTAPTRAPAGSDPVRVTPTRYAAGAEPAGTAGLAADLRAAVRGAVRFDRGSRTLFSVDASNYRHLPVGIVAPVDTDDLLAALEVCRRHDAPVLPRGAATSIGGQAVNTAVVLDCSRHLDRVLDLDPDARTARVQPGTVLDVLRAAAAPHGLTFGPDPSTHSRCTLGGMIGNNACGSHSVAYGKTVDNVRSLDVVTWRGTRLTVGPTSADELAATAARTDDVGRLYRELVRLRDDVAADIRTDTPDLTRRVSGYNLDQLLPENGFDLARALVGSEGTCATVLEATVALVPVPAHKALVVLGFPDAPTAADHVLPLREHGPLTIEGVDAGLIAALRAGRPDETTHTLLPAGGGWLYVETGGETAGEAQAAADAVAATGRGLGATSVVVSEPAAMRRLWSIREAGAGILTRGPGGVEAWPGWEDAAVPPARLGSYLRQFTALLDAHGRRGAYYGHFGDGCVHVRIDFDLLSADGVRGFRRFVEDAADLVVAHGGSLSGEHGDGQARAELLPRMYPPRMIRAFERFKGVWDPDDRMNPGQVVRPRRLDDDLRVYLPVVPTAPRTSLALSGDGGSLLAATRRCVGVGSCLSADGGVMCPSYRVTREEAHSTRGRARLLYEMASGRLGSDPRHADEVADALDLCLSCKGCKRDCPVGVDMASYKTEFLSQRYARRLRPASHYSMGFLPWWLRAASLAPGLADATVRVPALAALAKRLGGVTSERDLPRPASRTLRATTAPSRRRGAGRRAAVPRDERPRLLLWPDTFTNHFDPAVGRDAVAVLEGLGYRVELPDRPVCCGLTWFSTGQVGHARRVLRRSLAALRPWLADGVPVVVLEPSCMAALRTDAEELLPGDVDAQRLSAQVRTLAEVLHPHREQLAARTRPGAERAVVQVHCHQYAEVGFGPDREVLAALGVEADVLDSGCCGLAGNFGFEKGHYEVSQACAERVLLPAVRAAGDGVAVLADGFSCRTQVRQAGDSRPEHLAQLAARALRRGPAGHGTSAPRRARHPDG